MSIAVEPIEQKVSVQPFGKRNANRERIQQAEEELKNLLEKKEDTASRNESDDFSNQASDENLSPEEKSFKKRYGDLRRHSQQQQSNLQKQIDELKQQLTASTNQQIKLPANEDELDSWMKQYPDVAKIVKTIAIKEAREQSAALEDRFRALDEREKLTAREKAELELLKIHPDFNEIRDTNDFHDWAEEQPQWVQKALYENDTDARAAARAIDLYKVDRNIGKAAPKKNKGAAESIPTRGVRTEPSGQDMEGVIYESQVNKMTSRQYEANQEAIAKAINSGKFVYDLTGKAR